MGGRRSQVEIKSLEDVALHVDYLSLGVGVISDIGEVGYLRREYLLKLGGNVHSTGTHQLQLRSQDRHVGEKPGDRVLLRERRERRVG